MKRPMHYTPIVQQLRDADNEIREANHRIAVLEAQLAQSRKNYQVIALVAYTFMFAFIFLATIWLIEHRP